MKQKTALIAGSSGLVGGILLSLLLESELYKEIIVVTRRPLDLNRDSLRQVIVNFDCLELYANDMRCDDVFCCLGTTIKKAGSRKNFSRVDHGYCLSLAALTRNTGATGMFVVSSMGASPGSPVFYNRVKGMVEEDLKKIGFEKLHFFRPSLLVGERGEFRPGEKIASLLMRPLGPLFSGPLKKYPAISAEKVARSMIRWARCETGGVFIHESDEMQNIQ